MKKMLMVSVIAAGVLTMTGCSSDSDDSSNGGGSNLVGEPVSITTPEAAANAAATVGNQGSSVSPSAQRASLKSPSLTPVNETKNCVDGGTRKVTGDISDTSSDITITYDQCTDGDTYTDGVLKGKSTTDASKTSGQSQSIDLVQRYSYNGQQSEIKSNATYDYTLIQNVSADYISSGAMEYKNLNLGDGRIGMDNYKTTFDSQGTYSIDGGYSVQSSKYECINGVYNVETKQRLAFDYNTGNIADGELDVNGVNFVFNSEGTITVTYADGTTDTIPQRQEIVCP